MGIDLDHRKKRSHRTETQSEDPYLRLLIKLYEFLARRTDSAFNQTVLKRLQMSKTNRPPVSVSKIARLGSKDLIVVVVGTVTDDERYHPENFPALSICALRFTKSARSRIVNAGGRCITFDQLAMERPTGTKTLLVRGKKNAREIVKHFRGLHGKHATPYVKNHSNRRKFERKRIKGKN